MREENYNEVSLECLAFVVLPAAKPSAAGLPFFALHHSWNCKKVCKLENLKNIYQWYSTVPTPLNIGPCHP